ncbi:MAG: hypothetical protein ACFFD4_13155 [Candidatus Odinarchaeota archaeon]
MKNAEMILKIEDSRPGYDKYQSFIFHRALRGKITLDQRQGIINSIDPNSPALDSSDPNFERYFQLYLARPSNMLESTVYGNVQSSRRGLYYNFLSKHRKVPVLGYITADTRGRVSYPWIIPDYAINDNRDLLYEEMTRRLRIKNIKRMAACYDDSWGDVLYYFIKKGFQETRRLFLFSGKTDSFVTRKTDCDSSFKFRPFIEEDIDRVLELPSLKGRYTVDYLMGFISKPFLKKHLVIEKESEIVSFTSAFIMKKTGMIAGASTIPHQLLETVIRKWCAFFGEHGIKEFYIRQLGDIKESITRMKKLPLELEGEFVTVEKSL